MDVQFQQVEQAMRGAPLLHHGDLQRIPARSGVYTAWVPFTEDCFYVGKATNLLNRIRSHYSGQRGSDQFCLYVYDQYVFPTRSEGLRTPAVNRLTATWVREHVAFRVVEIPSERLSEIEATLRRAWQPVLNPLPV